MANKEDLPPADGRNRVANALASLYGIVRAAGGGEGGGGVLSVLDPIPVYGLGRPQRDSDPAKLLSRVHPIGWRYLVFHNDRVSIADIRNDGADTPELVGADRLAKQILNAGAFAQRAVGNDPGYHLRLLDLSIIGQVVLWLVSDGNAPDRFFSLGANTQELNSSKFLQEMSNAERNKASTFDRSLGEAGG